MSFTILLDSPILSRAESFAQKLAAKLGNTTVRDITTLPKEALPASLFVESQPHFILLYAEKALTFEPWRKNVNLKIYLDASQVDITADIFRALETTVHNTQSRTLADDVQNILREKTDQGEQSPRNYADLVIEADEELDDAVSSISGYITRIDPKTSRAFLDEAKRRERLDQMIRQYQHTAMKSQKAKFKRQLWMVVINATLILKRMLDIIFSFTALFLLSPLFLIVALLIKIYDRGPVFYVQKRVGLHGKEFPFPKFRSMVRNADALKDTLLQKADRAGDITFKMKKDPRITPIGRFIRRFSIDELPQFWCVLNGDMSIVGPRPPVPREVALYTQEDRRRLEVKPGLTGIWQVSGRAEIGFKQQVELDVLYIESHGFWLDVKLILKTIPAVLTGKGAY